MVIKILKTPLLFSSVAALLVNIIVLFRIYLNIGPSNKTKMCWKGNFEV